MRFHRASAVVILGLCLASRATELRAQDSDAERLKKLEDTVQKQQGEIEELKKARTPAKKDEPITGSLTEGLRFKSADGDVDIHFGGRFQEHFRDVYSRPVSSRTTPDSFWVRAARLKMDGTFFKEFGFLVEGDFPSATTGPSPTLQAAFVEWKRFKELRVMFGEFKSPFSQDRLRSRLFSDFVEDSMVCRFVPGFEIGVQVYGAIADGALGYNLAVTNGRSHLDNAGRLRFDDNDGKEYGARLTFQPFVAEKESPLSGLRIGFSGTIGDVDQVSIAGPVSATNVTINASTNFDIVSNELGVTMLDPNLTAPAAPTQLDGRRSRVGGDVSYALGPACLRGEYLYRKDTMASGATRTVVPITAWYGSFTVILTGEDKNPETRIVPLHNFLDGGVGAVELAFRVGGSRIGQQISNVGVLLAGEALEVMHYTAGVNWWLTRNVRISADWVREVYHTPINFGAAGGVHHILNGFLMRFQIDF